MYFNRVFRHLMKVNLYYFILFYFIACLREDSAQLCNNSIKQPAENVQLDLSY